MSDVIEDVRNLQASCVQSAADWRDLAVRAAYELELLRARLAAVEEDANA